MQDVSFVHQVVKRRTRLLNYMLFLRVTPTLPNTFINVASPIVDVPYHIFFLATFIGLIPAAYVTVRVFILLLLLIIYLLYVLAFYVGSNPSLISEAKKLWMWLEDQGKTCWKNRIDPSSRVLT